MGNPSRNAALTSHPPRVEVGYSWFHHWKSAYSGWFFFGFCLAAWFWLVVGWLWMVVPGIYQWPFIQSISQAATLFRLAWIQPLGTIFMDGTVKPFVSTCLHVALITGYIFVCAVNFVYLYLKFASAHSMWFSVLFGCRCDWPTWSSSFGPLLAASIGFTGSSVELRGCSYQKGSNNATY